ncbi:MAG: type IV pilus secretin PilQ, partial [Pseudomonadota bacterium]
MKSKLGQASWSIRVWVLLSLCLSSNFAAATVLKDLQFSALPGDQAEIRLVFDEAPPSPRGYVIENPAQIVLDLPNVQSGLEDKYQNLNLGNTRSITVVESQDRARLVIKLGETSAYQTVVKGNQLFVTVGATSPATKLAQLAAADTETEGLIPQSQGSEEIPAKKSYTEFNQKSSVQNIDFRRGKNGEGVIAINLSDAGVVSDLREENGKIIIEFFGTQVPKALQRRLDVLDFATPVQMIETFSEDDNARVVIHPGENYDYLAYQSDNQYNVSVHPISATEKERRNKDQFIFTGDKLAINIQNVAVHSVLQVIADTAKLNLVVSDAVKGNISVRLDNVPWDQALELVLKTKGLDKRKVGNVLLVAPAEEIAAREKMELETVKQVQELAPLRTEYIQVNYAKAKDLVALISGGEGEGESGFLSSRGSVSVDERTNTVLIQDSIDRIEEVRNLFTRLDIPVQQVLIEARVVIANADFNKDLGVRWGFLGLPGSPSSKWIFGGSSDTIGEITSPEDDGTVTISRPNNLSVDLGVTNSSASSFAVGYSNLSTGFLELELSALESDGMADIISTPKVLTADQQTARISSGTQIPYQEASSSGATSIAFREASLTLEVTP